MVDDEVVVDRASNEQRRASEGGLLTNLTSSARAEGSTAHDNLRDPPTSTRAQTRPVSHTRASAPLHDQETLVRAKKAFKYSEVAGLGTPWDK